ncbi:hypothetical protein WJX74_007029 [Apatococcus lobatus]|uniref:Uncharacterized protein n=1 Tax=Apatococcus lobatus TaxID=904363 RepID=A0AAW1QHH1_9CHLO
MHQQGGCVDFTGSRTPGTPGSRANQAPTGGPPPANAQGYDASYSVRPKSAGPPPSSQPAQLSPESRRLQQLAALVATEQALEEELAGLDTTDETLLSQLPPEIASKLQERNHQAALAAQEAMSHSGRSPTRRRSKHLAKHPQPWQGKTRRSGHAAVWEDEDLMSDNGKGSQAGALGGAWEARHPHHVVQEPNAMYNRTQMFRQKVAQRYETIRQAREEELAGKCTFHPKINNLSRLLLESLAQGWNPASPRSSYNRSPRARSEFEDPEGGLEQGHGHAPHLTAADRLYNQAMDSKARVREAAQRAIQEELDSYLAASPRAQKLSASIYGPGSESRVDCWRTHPLLPQRPRTSPYNFSGLDECTFHPRTNWSRVLEGQTSDFNHMRERPATAGAADRHSQAGRSDGYRASQDDLNVGDRFGLSVNLDFAEFLDRQQRFIEERDRKLAQEAAQHSQKASVSLAPGTQRILAQHSLSPSQRGREDSENRAPSDKGSDKLVLTGLQRFASMSSNFGMGKREMTRQVLAEEAERMTFHPHILRKSAARPARSVEEMSEGDRLRREVWVEQMKLQQLAAEQQELTFRPAVNRTGTARINLRNPGTYLSTLKARNEARAQQAKDEVRRRVAKELAECTFKPKIRAIPAQVYQIEHVDAQEDTRSETGYSEHYVAVM